MFYSSSFFLGVGGSGGWAVPGLSWGTQDLRSSLRYVGSFNCFLFVCLLGFCLFCFYIVFPFYIVEI